MPPSPSQTHPSPLDGAMSRLLAVLQDQKIHGSLAPKRLRELADELEVPAPFVQALVQSAQRRGLIRPEYLGGNKIVWHVTTAGKNLLGRHPEAREASIDHR